MEKLKILILEDSFDDVELIQYELKKGGIQFISKIIETKDDFINELNDFRPDIILADHSMPQFNSMEALKVYKENGIGVPFILVTGSVSEEFAVQAILAGASDYILKTNLIRLPSAVNNAMRSWRAVQEKEKAEREVELMDVFLNQVMDSQPIVFYIAKAGGDFAISFISRNVKNITGFHAEQFMDNPNVWSENIHPDDADALFQSLPEMIAVGGGNCEYRWKCVDNTFKWFLDNFKVVKDNDGEEFIHGSWIDITNLKNADLRKLVFSKGMDEMLFMISHKVRHSISQILGLTSLIEEKTVTEEEIKDIIGYMKEPTESLNLFTEELTHFMDDLKKRNNRLQ